VNWDSHLRSDHVSPEVQGQRFADFIREGRRQTTHQPDTVWSQSQTINHRLQHDPNVHGSSARLDENPWPRRSQDQRVQHDSSVWSGNERIQKLAVSQKTQGKKLIACLYRVY